MYLTGSVRDFEGRVHEMVGVFPARAVMRRPGLTVGYRLVELLRACMLREAGTVARRHECHSFVLEPQGSLASAYLTEARRILRGAEGILLQQTSAGYTHIHFDSRPSMGEELLQSVGKGAQASVAHD